MSCDLRISAFYPRQHQIQNAQFVLLIANILTNIKRLLLESYFVLLVGVLTDTKMCSTGQCTRLGADPNVVYPVKYVQTYSDFAIPISKESSLQLYFVYFL